MRTRPVQELGLAVTVAREVQGLGRAASLVGPGRGGILGQGTSRVLEIHCGLEFPTSGCRGKPLTCRELKHQELN